MGGRFSAKREEPFAPLDDTEQKKRPILDTMSSLVKKVNFKMRNKSSKSRLELIRQKSKKDNIKNPHPDFVIEDDNFVHVDDEGESPIQPNRLRSFLGLFKMNKQNIYQSADTDSIHGITI